jgi:tetratricopeptide (TPR) repeat protein
LTTLHQDQSVAFQSGVKARAAGDLKNAIMWFDQARLAENQSEESMIGILSELGDCLYMDGQYARALVVIEECVALCPRSADHLFRLGFCYYSCNNYALSKSTLEKCLAINGSDANSNVAIASVALNILARLKEVAHVKNIANLWDDGCNFYRDRKYSEASRCFKSVVKLQKQCESQMCAAGLVALTNIGLCYSCLERPNDALDVFDV